MAEKINYSANSLLNVKFTANTKGYEPNEVDSTLDKVINDYSFYEKYYEEAKKYIKQLEKEVSELNEKNHQFELDLATMKNHLKALSANGANGQNNLALLQRISKLENALYLKGVDPTKIK